jgi:hypothetical protein
VRALVLGATLVSAFAQAEEARVPAQAEVVFASIQPGTVEAALAPMQAKLGARVKYLTLTSVSSTKLQLSSTRSTVRLPNGKTAELTLLRLKDNVAQVQVKLPPLDVTYSLGKEKSFYVQAGPHGAGELWLVVSQPR